MWCFLAVLMHVERRQYRCLDFRADGIFVFQYLNLPYSIFVCIVESRIGGWRERRHRLEIVQTKKRLRRRKSAPHIHTNLKAKTDSTMEEEPTPKMPNNNAVVASTPPPACRSSPSRNGLSWSQSVEMSHETKTQEVRNYFQDPLAGRETLCPLVVCCTKRLILTLVYPATATQPSQTQEILTQNVELTQLGDNEDGSILSPLPPYSPSALRRIPWGRFMPLSGESGDRKPWELLPKDVEGRSGASGTTAALDSGGVSLMGLHHIQPCDIFNLYTVGRSSKADFIVPRVKNEADKNTKAMLEWSYAMISNQHFKVYCTLSESGPDVSVWLEDCSGNGTLVNQTTLLRKGERRLLHAGDEICVVNPTSLRRKVRKQSLLTHILQQYSFVFVRQQYPPNFGPAAVMPSTLSFTSSFAPWKPPPSTRKAAVNARETTTGREPVKLLAGPPERRLEQDYEVRDLLGEGTAGLVRRAIHRKTGQERAVKVIRLMKRPYATASTNALADVQAEAKILQGLEHPYIVELDDFYVTDSAVYLVMELLQGGDLFDRIVDKGQYSETESRRVMRRLLAAIYYLHEEQNVVHRDLKPENILLCSRANDVQVKLTDFGLAKTVNDEGCKTFCGTPQYFAPEVLSRQHTVKGRGRYGKPADMWSLGVILYVLLSGTTPFEDEHTVDFPDEYWTGVSAMAKDLVRRLLQTDPCLRFTVQQACEHEWILTDDGDTHTHPLQDPIIVAATTKSKEQASEDETATSTETERGNASSAGKTCSEDAEATTDKSPQNSPKKKLCDSTGQPASDNAVQVSPARGDPSHTYVVPAVATSEGSQQEDSPPLSRSKTARVSDEIEMRRPLSPTSCNTRSEAQNADFRCADAAEKPAKQGDELDQEIESFGDADESIASFATTEEETKGLLAAAKREKAASANAKKRKRRRISKSVGDSLASIVDDKQTTLASWIKSTNKR